MGLLEILRLYADRPTSTEADFDEVATQVPHDVLGNGLAQAFRSDQTPAFGQMVSQLFGRSNPQQRAGLLNQLVAIAGPALLAKVAGGAFSRFGEMAAPGAGAGVAPTISPTDAEQLTPEQVRSLAEEAQKKDPSVMDRIGGFYGQHPEVVKVLGGAALAIALGQMANRMKG